MICIFDEFVVLTLTIFLTKETSYKTKSIVIDDIWLKELLVYFVSSVYALVFLFLLLATFEPMKVDTHQSPGSTALHRLSQHQTSALLNLSDGRH